MILLNKGLTDAEREKITHPYSRNSLGHAFSYADAGRGVGQFAAEHRDLLLDTAALLDCAQTEERA